MVTLTPVEGNPFEKKGAAPNMVPVEGNPFAPAAASTGPKLEFPDAPTIANLTVPGAITAAMDPGYSITDVLAAKYGPSFTDDPRKRQAILARSLPGAKPVNDRFGNPMIEYEGKKYYASRPGEVDAMDVARVTNPLNQAALVAGMATGGLGLLPAMGVGSLLGGGASVAEDVLANAASGDRLTNIDPKKAAFSAGIGAAAPPAVSLLRGAATLGRNVLGYGDNLSTLHPEARKALLERLAADEISGRSVTALNPELTLAEAGPNLFATAQGAVTAPKNTATKQFIDLLRQRNEGTNAALGREVEAALGPAGPDQLAYAKALSAEKSLDLNPRYANIWQTATDVDPTSVVKRIDAMLAKTDPATAEGRVLTAFKSKLVSSPAQPSQRIAVTDPRTGRILRYRDIPSQPAKYVTDPQVLHSIKRDLGSTLIYGDPSLGVDAAAVRQGAGKKAYESLSSLLKYKVPGYRDATSAAEDFFKRIEGLKLGYDVLDVGKTAAPPGVFNAQVTPKNIADVRAGARARIENTLGTKENDLQALRGAIADTGDWRRQALERLYGPDAVNQLAGAVDLRQTMRSNYGNLLQGSQTATRTASEADLAARAKGSNVRELLPPSTSPTGLALNVGASALDKMRNVLPALGKEKFYPSLTRSLALQGPERDLFVRRLLEEEARRRGINAATIGAGPMVSGLLGQ